MLVGHLLLFNVFVFGLLIAVSLWALSHLLVDQVFVDDRRVRRERECALLRLGISHVCMLGVSAGVGLHESILEEPKNDRGVVGHQVPQVIEVVNHVRYGGLLRFECNLHHNVPEANISEIDSFLEDALEACVTWECTLAVVAWLSAFQVCDWHRQDA